MKRRVIRGLRRATRRLRSRFAPSAVILMYHRVAEVPTDPHRLCVSPQHFAEQLEVLRRHAHPMRLRELDRALVRGNLPRRAVVLTFDDGYGDMLRTARPLLERHDVPATAFVTSGYLGSEREFWWDELERILLEPGELPAAPRLTIGQRHREWMLGEAATYGDDAFQRHRRWNYLRKRDPTPRQRLYRILQELIMTLSEPERRDAMDQVRAWVGAALPVRPSHRILSPSELIQLADGGLVEVGAHSVTHPMLSARTTAEQRFEIRQSKADLEKILGRPVRRFAYPFGEYNAETVALVEEAGFTSACAVTTVVRRRPDRCSDAVRPDGPVRADTVIRRRVDRLQLPRVAVMDWDGDQFARQLRKWLLA